MRFFSLILLLALSNHLSAEEKTLASARESRHNSNMLSKLARKGDEQPSKDDLERFKQTINKLCGSAPLSKWQPTAFFSSGWQSILLQVCSHEDCNFVLKIVSPEEAAFSEQMGQAQLGPAHIDSISCDAVPEKRAIVMEKLDGNLGDFLFPLKSIDKIFPQVLNLIYHSITELGVCQNDTKFANFFYRLEADGLPKIYLGDYGIARRCDELKDPKRENYSHLKLKSTLREYLNLFIKSYFKPAEFGMDTEIDPLTDARIAKNFLSQLNDALQKDEKWRKYFPSVDGFNFGYLIRAD